MTEINFLTPGTPEADSFPALGHIYETNTNITLPCNKSLRLQGYFKQVK